MVLQEGLKDKYSKNTLFTKGWNISKIPDIYRVEDHPIDEGKALFKELNKENWPHEEMFGEFCNLSMYFNCPVKKTFDYVANLYSLDEWTYTVRNVSYIGDGLYSSIDHVSGADIYFRTDAYPDSGVVDMFCAWDQSDELWMRYHFRFVDAMPVLRKPGTVALWTNCKHPYYDRSVLDVPEFILEARDRPRTKWGWVGDIWPFFYVGHKLEFENLKHILEYNPDS